MDLLDSTKTGRETGPLDALAPETPQAFGQRLTALRENKGLALASVAHATRIRPNFVAALEGGRFAELPGAVFARGFVRTLAKLYEVDGTGLAAAFEAALNPQSVGATDAEKSTPRARPSNLGTKEETRRAVEAMVPTFSAHNAAPMRRNRSNAGSLSSLFRTMGALALIGLATVGVRFLLEHRHDIVLPAIPARAAVAVPRPSARKAVVKVEKRSIESATYTGDDEHKPGVPTNVAVAPVGSGAVSASVPDAAKSLPVIEKPTIVDITPKTAAVPDPTEKVAVATPPSSLKDANAAPFVVSTSPSKEVPLAPVAVPPDPSAAQTLDLVVSKSVRVRMDLDAAPSDVKELKPDTYHLTFSDAANLLIYDASALTIRFNGQPLGELGAKGRVRRLSFRARLPKDPTAF